MNRRSWSAVSALMLGITLIAACGGSEDRKASQPAARNASEGVAEAGDGRKLGTTVAWGNNGYRQVGDGTVCDEPVGQNCNRFTPVAVLAPGGSGQLSELRSIVAGESHTLGLRTDRTVVSWGFNGDGELGNGTFNLGNPVAAPVVGPRGKGRLSKVTALGGGSSHSLAVAENGRLWTWGGNIWGQLGVGTSTGPEQCNTRPAAAPSAPPPPAAQKPAGDPGEMNFACALAPTAVLGADGKRQFDRVMAVSGGTSHSVALRRDGTVWTWGLNGEGQLGVGTTDGPEQCKPFPLYGAIGCSTKPVQVVGPDGRGHLTDITAIAAGSEFTLALRSDGTVWAWGSNAFNSLGQSDPNKLEECRTSLSPLPQYCSSKPLQVVGPGGSGYLRNVTQVAAEGSVGALHGVALKTDGTVWAWGINDMGQLGNGKSEDYQAAPVHVVDPDGKSFLTGVVEVAAGSKFTVARKSDGTVWAWGYNLHGELGIGLNDGPERCTTSNYPCSTKAVQVRGVNGSGLLTGISAIAVGNAHIVAATTRK